LDFGDGNDVAWLRAFGLALLGAKPFSGVDLWLRRRGRGLVLGWREPAVRDEAFDGYDHRKGFDLAGNAASGGFGAEIGQFPEPSQNLVATEVQVAQSFGFLVDRLFPDGGAAVIHGSG
jgi:hypothetical protein